MKRFLMLCLVAGCAQLPQVGTDAATETAAPLDAMSSGETPTRPRARPDSAAAATDARDVPNAEATTEAAQPASEEATPVAAPAARTTLVSLGDVTEGGIWIKTPLVQATSQGTARNPATGKTATVTLIPIDGPPTAGSRASLQAMQALGLSLTDIAEVEVTAL